MNVAVPDSIQPLRDQVLRFVEERIYPVEPILDKGLTDPESFGLLRSLMDEAKSEGLWALGHPASLGGGGLSFFDYVYVNEAIGRSDHALWVFGTHSLQDSLLLEAHASQAIRERYLLPLVKGEIIQSFGMTEPDVASSDPTQL